jgi:hypothetical protein
MLQEYDAGRDPVDTMNVLKALRWTIYCWQNEVSKKTVLNCFKKALNPVPPAYREPVNSDIITNLEASLANLRLKTPIKEQMDIQAFLNPDNEVVEDSLETLDDHILA